MVGDSQSDIDAAHNAGVKAIVFRTHYNQEITNADFEVKNLNEVLNLI
jgi:phosphoglycolate phosphatase-like HAD superfamily hydrolase